MELHEIWSQLERKEPRLKQGDARIEFTPSNLRALLRQVYDKGYEKGQKEDSSKLGNIFGGGR